MWLWKFKVNGYDEAFGEFTDEGVVCGEDLVGAVSNLSDYYGDNMFDIYVAPAGESEDVYITGSTLDSPAQNVVADSQ